MENPMDPLRSLSDDLAGAVERAATALVAVNARPRLPSTGVHWRPGVVVTADHTVSVDEEITVTRPDGRTVAARLSGRDPSTDVAVLAVEDAGFPTAEIGDAASLRIGHLALALGHGPRASFGMISSLGGRWQTPRGGEIDQLIRLDLTLYPGFSGGPLVDAHGRVVGINTSGLSRMVRLAIPASTVARVADELLQKGRIARGYLGLGMQPVRLPEAFARGLGLSRDTGLIVVNVEADGPAARAGLLIGDVLVALDDMPVGDTDDVQHLLGPRRIGAAITLSLVRAGALVRIPMTVGERPQRRRR